MHMYSNIFWIVLFKLLFLVYLSGNGLFARENQKKDKQYDDLLIGVHFGGGWTQINLNRVDNPKSSTVSRKETQYELEGLRSTLGYFLGYMPFRDFMVTIGIETDRYHVKNQEKYNEDDTKILWLTSEIRYYFLCTDCYTSISARARFLSSHAHQGGGYTLNFAKELWLSDYSSLGIGFFYNYTKRKYLKVRPRTSPDGSTIYETETSENYYGIRLTVAYDL